MPCQKCGGNDRCEGADGEQSARGKEISPPARLTFRKAWRDGSPDALTIVFTGIGDGQRVHGGEDGFDFFERGAAFGASAEVFLHAFALLAIVKSDQFFLCRVFHFFFLSEACKYKPPNPLFHPHCFRSAFCKRFESCSQFLYGAKYGVFCRGRAGFQNCGNFVDAAAVPVAHDDGGALRGSKFS